MLEFFNENLGNKEPEYFYRVTESVTTFKGDPGKNDAFTHTQDFRGDDLLMCRAEAIRWFNERHLGLIKKGLYFLPFASPQNFIQGKNAAYSIDLYFVQYYNDDDQSEFNLTGDPIEIEQSLWLENAVLEDQGLA